MSDLTDFLLARIGEDEAMAHRMAAGWINLEASDDEAFGWFLNEDHVLAQCEAKRRIVQTWQEKTEAVRNEPDAYYGDDSLNTLTDVVRVLAAAYDYHLDYQGTWRP